LIKNTQIEADRQFADKFSGGPMGYFLMDCLSDFSNAHSATGLKKNTRSARCGIYTIFDLAFLFSVFDVLIIWQLVTAPSHSFALAMLEILF
jgi:hypothetical protein